MIDIRCCKPDDAATFLALCHALDTETSFMLLEPGERDTTVTLQRQRLVEMAASEDERMLVAACREALAGFVVVSRTPFRRVRHCFQLVIGVAEQYWGQRLGSRLMATAETACASTASA